MIDRQKLNKVLDAVEKYTDTDEVTVEVKGEGNIYLRIYPRNWWADGSHWSDEKRHEVLSAITPLVGKMEKHVDDRNIGYSGEKDGLSIRLNYVDQCKILGYKVVTKTVKKEIEREPEYETEEIEEKVAITDCDVRSGKFKESDIEVPV